jgi:hypothetical protein
MVKGPCLDQSGKESKGYGKASMEARQGNHEDSKR